MLILLALTGCAAPKGPAVEVVDAALVDLTDDGLVLRFALDAHNTSADPVPLREIDYTLRLDGKVVFRGTRSAEATIRRYGTQTLALPVAIPFADAPPSGQIPYELTGTIAYIPPGAFAEILFDADLVRPTISFKDRRRIDFDDLLAPE